MSSLQGKPLPMLFEKKNYCDGSTDWCLDVRFTAACDNACSFCIAAEDMKRKKPFHMDAMVDAVKRSTHVSGLSIIGGEPLLFLDKLITFIERVKEEAPHIKHFYVTTSLPYTLVSQRVKFDQLMEHVEILNVSLQHYTDETNNLLLQAKKRFSRMELLEDLLSVESYRPRIRVHLNLSRGGIDTAEELNLALYKLRSMGVVDVKLNELMNAPDDYVSFEDITGEELASPYAHGCSSTLDYFPGITVTLKRSCFVVEPSRAATKQDLLKLMAKGVTPELDKDMDVDRVLYEDGTLTNRWMGDAV